MALRAGDRVQEQARSTSRPARTGVIAAVLREDPAPRYRIRWDDGRESVHTPGAGGLVRLPGPRRARTGTARRRS